MRSIKLFNLCAPLVSLSMAIFLITSTNESSTKFVDTTIFEPNVESIVPTDGETSVARNIVIEITFSEEIDSAKMENLTFSLMQDTDPVEGTMEYSGNKGTFTATKSLKAETEYTAKLTTSANQSDEGYSREQTNDDGSVKGTSVMNAMEWSFTTGGNSDRVDIIDLGSAAHYVILVQSSINNDSTSEITGEKGFDSDLRVSEKNQINDNRSAVWLYNEEINEETVRSATANEMNTNREIEPTEYSSRSNSDNYDKAIKDMIVAYNEASERSGVDFSDYKLVTSTDRKDQFNRVNNIVKYNGANSGLEEGYERESFMNQNTYESSIILEPGIYKWKEPVVISTNISLSGNSDDVWIFQIPEGLIVNRYVEIILSDGAVAEHIFWQVAGEVNLGESSHFEGIILSLTGINMKNGATLIGRMLAQTEVTLDDNTIIEPQVLTASQRSSIKR